MIHAYLPPHFPACFGRSAFPTHLVPGRGCREKPHCLHHHAICVCSASGMQIFLCFDGSFGQNGNTILQFIPGGCLMHSYFCGWYFRCQSDQQTLAVIPSVHKPKPSKYCTLQLITDTQAFHVPFPFSAFQKKDGQISLGGNRFGKDGICLAFILPICTSPALFGLARSRPSSMTSWGRSAMFPSCNAGTVFSVCATRWMGRFGSTARPLCFGMPSAIWRATVGIRSPQAMYGHSAAFQTVR